VAKTPPAVEVLLRAPRWAAISKPAGLSVAAERNKPGETPLLDAIAAALETDKVLVVHRLDRETSGVMLVAMEETAHRALSIQFQKREVKKTYLALIRGAPHVAEGEIDAPLEPDPRGGSLMRVARGERARDAKRSFTRWSVRERFRGFTLLEVRPETGRQHQIRVHLRHVDLPLAVDPQYGGADGIYLSELKRGYKPSRDRPEPPIIGRVTLHAESLEFRDPDGGAVIRVEAPVPPDLGRALDTLRRFASAG
jgi:23S rRNA pseudouridine1911/1915/1917 synthase